MSNRPRRSVLYMSGANARSLEKALTLRVDSLIFDLEDAVVPDQKVIARDQVIEALAQKDYGCKERIVRVNSLTSPWGIEDIKAVAKSKLDGVLLPKVESAAMIKEAVDLLDGAGGSRHLAIWAMVESPQGVLRVEEIAQANPRLEGLIMGTSDLAKDLHARQSQDRGPILVSLHLCLLAARAYGLTILDGVHIDLKDESGLRATAMQARNMGFNGKTLIHPSQVDIVNQVFSPTRQEVEQSRAIVRAWAEAVEEGKGVCVVNGKLVEKLHVEEAERILRLTNAIAGNQDF